MKRKLYSQVVLFSLLMGIASSSYAQHSNFQAAGEFSHAFSTADKKPKLRIGLKGGPNFNRYSMKRLPEYRGKYRGSGFDMGLYFMFAYDDFDRRYAMEIDLLYSQTHAEGQKLYEGLVSTSDFNLHALRVPVTFSYTFKGRGFKPFLLGGANLGKMLDLSGSITYDNEDWLDDVLVSPLLVGACGGVGALFSIGETFELKVESRYNLSYLNIFDHFSTLQTMVSIGF